MEQGTAAQSGLRPGPIDNVEGDELVIDLRPSQETSPDAPPYTSAMLLSAVPIRPIRASKLRAGLTADEWESLAALLAKVSRVALAAQN